MQKFVRYASIGVPEGRVTLRTESAAIVRPITDVLRARLEKAKASASESGWELAKVITTICDKEAFRKWHFASREAWVQQDLKGFYGASSVSRLVKVVHRVEKMSVLEADEFRACPIWNAIEALEADTVEEARALLTSGKTQHEIRAAVKEKREGVGPRDPNAPARPEEFASLNIPPMPIMIVGQWEAIKNLVRFVLDRDTPGDVQILEYLFSQFLLGWETTLDPKVLKHETSDGIVMEWTMGMVAAGKVRCRMCGSWDRTKLTPHHVIPRSRQCRGCGPEHAVPIELLCAQPCHASVKDSPEANWRAWAYLWGYEELAKLHK